MQLTNFTDYSLRALIYISVNRERCTVNDIATSYSISHNHLIKVIHNLSLMGIIKTTRGKNGGICLATPPEKINLKILILKLEPNFDLVPCFNKKEIACCIAPICKLKDILYEAKKAFLTVLEHYTLADLIQNPIALGSLLNTNTGKFHD